MTPILNRGLLTSARRVVLSALVVLIVAGLGALIFIYSGRYDIAARRPHLMIVRSILTMLQERSVGFHASGIEVPPLDDPARVREGLVLYRKYCVVCHGAPGEAQGRVGIGLNPSPPPLVQAGRKWSDGEIYWIATNGLKMAGMPAFGLGHDPDQLWSITAFVRRMQTLSPREYQRMVAAAEGATDPGDIRWVAGDQGWARLREAGNPEQGAALISGFGCASCHTIPGIDGPRGNTGPPLGDFARQHYFAGRLVNTPENLIQWIIDPPGVDPRTAMPALGVTPEQALHIAAYLYSLGGKQ